MIKFSILTACSKINAKYIFNLAKSLDRQKFNNFEWNIICSNPKNLLYLKRIVPNTHLYRNNSKSTLGAMMNSLISKSTGTYLLFVDADDYLDKDALIDLDKAETRFNDYSYLVDLNSYKTYEPRHNFLQALKVTKQLGENPKPEWGGSKQTNPSSMIMKSSYRPSPLLDSKEGIKRALEIKYQPYIKTIMHFDGDIYFVFRTDNNFKYPHYLRSVLRPEGKAIPRGLVQDCYIRFSNTNYYSNFSFMISVCMYTKYIVSMNNYYYYMLYHNDPVDYPSLYQRNSQEQWNDLYKELIRNINIVSENTNDYSKNQYLKKCLLYYSIFHFCNRAYKPILSNLQYNTSCQSVDSTNLFRHLQFIMKKYKHIKFKGSVSDREILNNIKKGQFKKARKNIKFAFLFYCLHKLLKNRGRGITKVAYYKMYLHRPINNHAILYSSFLGRQYSDNPKYVYLYIRKHYPGKFLNIWVADNKNYKRIKHELSSQQDTIVVKRWGFKHMLYLATAKYFVNNMRQPAWFIKRNGMRFVETWHGTPLKKLTFDLSYIASASHTYKSTFYRQRKQWDYLVVDNDFSKYAFHSAFKYPENRMIETGYPRNDILYNKNNKHYINQIKNKLNIPLSKKVILYAPTWRDNQVYSSGQYKFTLHLNINLLKKYLNNNYVLLIRTHYFIANRLNLSKYGSFVKNVSNYEDISKLYLISNILITDYSSSFFDFASLQRPILYYVYDYDSYAKVLHGFYLNMKSLPGPLLKDSKSVLRDIINIKDVEKKYYNRYIKFNHKFNNVDNGHASCKVVKYLLKNK